MKKRDSLGDRMKNSYENRNKTYLTKRTPVMLRLDGKAFSTYTKGFERPFSKPLSDLMTDTALFLAQEIQGAKLVYTQSDEISILITDFDDIKTDAWFGYETSKMNSIAASLATGKFNDLVRRRGLNTKNDKLAFFDCRAFTIPREEVMNCFRWRYQDWLRNSIQMLAQANFSHKELHGKNKSNMHDMLMLEKGINWNDLDPLWKNGTLIYKNDEGKWFKDNDIKFIQEEGFSDFCKKVMKIDCHSF